MTEAIAIAATTYVLGELLKRRITHDYPNDGPAVFLDPPPRPASPANGTTPAEGLGLFLYMHHAAINTGWRNMYDPRINASGARAANAPLVLDLHYMLIATGPKLEREMALGIGMGAFNRFGIVPRSTIQSILSGLAAGQTGIFKRIGEEKLWLQPEQITVTLQALDLDLSTKLWSALQAPLRPSAYYVVTAVFLDPDDKVEPIKDVERVSIFGRPDADPNSPLVPDESRYPEPAG